MRSSSPPGGLSSGLFAFAAAVLLLCLISRVQIPMKPAPLTLQTLAIALVGATLGWRLGLAAILAWLTLAAAGWPVLAGGTGGAARFVGPTAGYLAAFPIAGALVGWRVEHKRAGTAADAFATMLLAHAVCLGLGAVWLALRVGVDQALHGLPPLLPGALVKSAVGAGAILWLPTHRRSRR